MSDGSEWKPLSVRTGLRPAPAMHEGVPEHLVHPLSYWLQGVFGYRTPGGMNNELMLRIASATEVRLSGRSVGVDLQDQILATCERERDVFLDVLDAALRFGGSVGASLRSTLESGNSVWTVSPNGRSLERRVDAAALESFGLATTPNDTASAELSEAWSRAYGRAVDPSDAWDHAIKAVEAVLIPMVCPGQSKPTLGHVVGALRGGAPTWQMVLPGPSLDNDPTPLVAMLQLLWPNPDRHGTPQGSRSPTQVEARAVVHLAVTLVQWARDGSAVTKR